MDCEMEYVGPLSGLPEDIWRCNVHRDNFTFKRGILPEVCPVASCEARDIFAYVIGVGLGEFWRAHDDELYEEHSLWLEAHGLHDEEEPLEDTFVGYSDDGEEVYL